MEGKISLGEFIQKRRKHLYMTQDQLADKIYVSKSAVAKWERNGGVPDRDNLYRLAEALGVTTNDLHRIIATSDIKENDMNINITSEVIAILESYGYTVISPGEKVRKKDGQ